MVPQVEAAIIMQVPDGSGAPAATVVHVPWLPATAHELHVPQLAAAQQKPSTQWVLRHSAPDRHDVPFSLRLVQEPDLHAYPAAHCVSSVHVVRQADVPQMYPEQFAVAGVAQAPVPVQWETGD